MNKLILVSNRLPIKITGRKGSPQFAGTDGGLATAVGRVSRRLQARWVGYLGDDPDPEITDFARQHQYYPVRINPGIYRRYYGSFSNRVLWPVLHGFAPFGSKKSHWDDYVRANAAFAEEVARVAGPDDVIWVHDYHLFLLPELLRARGLTNKIGFFLHTPFPGRSFFADTSAGRRMLRSLFLADSVGVQTKRSLKRLQQAAAGAGATVDWAAKTIRHGGRVIRAGAFPIGIDYRYFSRRVTTAEQFREQLLPDKGSSIILSLSRLDYTKGILELLKAAKSLARDPEYRGRFVLRLAVIPSREQQPEYQALKTRIERLVAQINRAATHEWRPIEYNYGTLGPDELLASYRQADIFIASPLADGMNLVAKEYLAANSKGMLILSREAGAAEQLNEALLVDPTDPGDIARAIAHSLDAPTTREISRRLRRIVRRENVFAWADNFLETLSTSFE